jgi:hypothetical protein
VEIQLSAEDYELLMRPVAGSGGWQSLLRKLQKQAEGRTLRLTESDTKRILRDAPRSQRAVLYMLRALIERSELLSSRRIWHARGFWPELVVRTSSKPILATFTRVCTLMLSDGLSIRDSDKRRTGGTKHSWANRWIRR